MAKLWVRPEPFLLGVLPIAPNPKLAPRFLQRIIPYAITKKQLGYPKLSYTVWKHIACNKLQLPEEVTWLYFTLFRCLHRGRHQAILQWDNLYSKRTTPQSRDHLKSLTSVDTVKFVLFLYLQHFNRISLRATGTSLSSDDWPQNRDKAGILDSRCNSRRSSRILDEKKHLAFVERRLQEIVEILTDNPKNCASVDGVISFAVVEALGFLIEGTVNDHKGVLPLCEIIRTPSLSVGAGFVPSKQVFHATTLLKWICGHLVPYPYRTSSCLPLHGANSLSNNFAETANGQRLATLTHLTKQTVAEHSETLKGTGFRIHRCHKSHIYLLLPLRSVVITKCRDTTVVLGPTEASVVMYMCKGVRIVGVCRQVLISECTECCLHLLTPNRPLLLGDRNKDLVFGPYHTSYPQLDEQMAEAGIGSRLNMWNSPLAIGSDGNVSVDASSCWKLLPPEDFYIFNIPFEISGTVKKIPGCVPDYYSALQEKKKQVESWHKMVKDARMTPMQKEQLNHLVRARFQEWLKTSGFQSELEQLVAFDRADPPRKHT